jgi:hypothetical protein
VALEARTLGGDGVEVPTALVAVKAALWTISKLSEDCAPAIEHEIRLLRGSTKYCKEFSGPTTKESVVAGSGLEGLLACLALPTAIRQPRLCLMKTSCKQFIIPAMCSFGSGLKFFIRVDINL